MSGQSTRLAQAAFWASAKDCRSTPDRRDDGPSVVTRYVCPPGRGVEIHLVRDNGRAWPGGERGSRLGDEPSATFNATDAIWEFIEAHSRQDAWGGRQRGSAGSARSSRSRGLAPLAPAMDWTQATRRAGQPVIRRG